MSRLILVTGAQGFIGNHLVRHLQLIGENVVGLDIIEGTEEWSVICDVSNPKAFAATIQQLKPSIIVHCAAMKGLQACEENKEEAFATNVLSTEVIATYARSHNIKVVYLSSDVVFNGQREKYAPSEKPSPINWYGKTKIFSETILASVPRAAVCRTALVIGPLGRQYKSLLEIELMNKLLVNQTLLPQYIYEKIRGGATVHLSQKVISNPTPVNLLCQAIERVIVKDLVGVLHTTGPDGLSRFDVGCLIADYIKADKSLIIADQEATSPLRPLNISMDVSESFQQLGINTEEWRMADYLCRTELYA